MNNTFELADFYNKYTLNLFSDASILKNKNKFTGCYESVAVVEDTIIDSEYRIATDTTVNESEIKGIRLSLSLAVKYFNQFERINVFSDSQISIFGLRDYIYNWRCKNNTLYSSLKKPVKNQSIFIECFNIMKDFQLFSKVSLLHQSGHVTNNYYDLQSAANTFRASNRIPQDIDINLIRYISTYNNFVDNDSRTRLRMFDKSKQFFDPISFYTTKKIEIF